MTKEASLEAVNSALSKEVRKLQEELKAADKTNMALTARVEELEGALKDLVRLVDEDQEEDAPPYLVDQVLDRARAVITKGERKG